jgi:hypothetical protein
MSTLNILCSSMNFIHAHICTHQASSLPLPTSYSKKYKLHMFLFFNSNSMFADSSETIIPMKLVVNVVNNLNESISTYSTVSLNLIIWKN